MIGQLIGPVTSILDKFIEDKDAKAKMAHEISTMAENHAQEVAMGQMKVNQAEAASDSIFKGGWRPFIGWTCGAAFAYHFIVQPFLIFVITAFGLDLPALPDFDMSSLMPVLLGMLGLGGMRSFEKSKGVAAK